MTAALLSQLQQALGDRYVLERELAPGGMSRLFFAREPALERTVVVKLLPPETASEVSAERFRREMLVTARLQHPHILPVLDAGARDELLYYVMPFVPGESLRARLERDGQLSVGEATRILRELADALACAHDVGVVHRDVKPENVLFQHGHAVLADFGIARALESTSGGDRLTATGLGIGTLGYMAPEQIAGEREVDARADLYALGVVGYEMLAGAPPFAGTTPMRVLAAQLTESPRPLEELRPDVTPALSAVIARLLQQDPSSRPQSTRDVLRDLEAIGPLAVAPVRSTSSQSTSRDNAHDVLFSTILANKRLDDTQVAWIKSAFVPRSFKKGQFFQRAGDTIRHGGFVTRGLFRLYGVDANGNESIIRFSPEANWIGDLPAALSGTPTSLYVDAIEPSEALVFDLPSYEKLLVIADQERALRMGLIRSREAMEKRIALSLHASAEERYADFVARHPGLAVRVPQRMLASYLGMTPETLSRIRRRISEG